MVASNDHLINGRQQYRPGSRCGDGWKTGPLQRSWPSGSPRLVQAIGQEDLHRSSSHADSAQASGRVGPQTHGSGGGWAGFGSPRPIVKAAEPF